METKVQRSGACLLMLMISGANANASVAGKGNY